MRIKKSLNTLFVAAFFVGVSLVANKPTRAASSANASANATASIIRGITIANTRDLGFGEAAQGTAALVIAPADGTSAQFTVGGEGGHAYNITLPGSATMLRVGGVGGVATDEIAVSSFTSNPDGSGSLSGVSGAAGSQTLSVGATRAAIPENQAAGNYTTSFSVTVAYP